MKVGSIGFATEQGIGILLKQMYDHGIVTDVVTLAHGRRPEHPEWFPGAVHLTRHPSRCLDTLREFCRAVDVMLFVETPFAWELLSFCRGIGVRTVLQPMYECSPEKLPDVPDLFLCPSLLDLDYFPDGKYCRSLYLPVPVDTDKVKWRRRERAEVFCHNAGHGGLRGRNGTRQVIEAWGLVKSDARLIVRSQGRLEGPWTQYPWSKVELVCGTVPYERLWDEGDVFLFPDKFNGLSLPLQEAHAAGMLVMSSDRYPANTWLPREPLIPVARTERGRAWGPGPEIDFAVVEPRDIARTVDAWYGADISAYSERGRQWAEAHSWQVLGPKYREILGGLL